MRRSALRAAVTLGLFLLALAIGFVLSSQVGQRWMREEAELQLGAILKGEVSIERVGLRLRTGLDVQAVGIRVDYPGPGLGAVSARRVVARLKTSSLLLGRFRVASLEADGLAIHLKRNAAGEWSPAWFPSRAELDEKRKKDAGDLEHELGWMKFLIDSAHLLLREQDLADHISLTGGIITVDDAQPRRGSRLETRNRFENIQASIDHGWLGNSSDFSLTARWVVPKAPRATLEMSGRQRGDEDTHLTIAFSNLELESLSPYIVSPRLGGEIAGRMAGVVAVTTPELGKGRIELDWSARTVEAQIPLGDTSLAFEAPLASVHAQFALEPHRLDIEEIRVGGQSLDFEVAGSLVRPLSRSSQTSLRSSLSGTSLEDLQRIADGLPETDTAPFRALLDRLRSGRIPRVGVRGTTALRTWFAIVNGELPTLPPTIRLSANIEDVTIGTSETDTLSDVSGELEWNGARVEMHDFRGQFNGEPMPRLEFTIDGLPTLLASPPDQARIARQARAVPGMGTLWELMRKDEEDEPEREPSPILVNVHELQHPALRWPVRDAVLEIVPDANDLDVTVTVTRGLWAGVPVSGRAEVRNGTEPSIAIEIRVEEEPADDDADPAEPRNDELEGAVAVAAPAAPAAGRAEEGTETVWASGTFSTSHVHTGPIEFATLDGHFAIDGQDLVVRAVDGRLMGGGTLSGEGVFSLSSVEHVASQATLRVREGEADRVAQTFGIAQGFMSGRADVLADLRGDLRIETRLIDELVGLVDIEARDGEVRQSVPLVAAVAHAIEGWSPTDANAALQYERIDTQIAFDRGRISTERFALEGPLRIVASGRIDLHDDPESIAGTLGVFLLRQAHQLLGDIPLVKLLIPGSDRGLIGAYFEISGPVAQPQMRAMPIRSLASGMPLPDVLRQPFEALIGLFPTAGGSDGRPSEPSFTVPEPE